MSTASPLPLQPLPPAVLSDKDARALKDEVASRLAEHRRRRARTDAQVSLPLEGLQQPAPRNRIASSVADRFSRRESYRDYLQHEAEAAMHQAAAEAEVARRSAEAIVAAQRQLLEEIAHEAERGPAEIIAISVPQPEPLPLAVVAPVPVEPVQTLAVSAVVVPEPEPKRPTIAELLQQQDGDTEERSATLPANLIEFPRQLVAARRARPRLAEGPLRDEADATPERAQLRIFEVEASSVSTTPEVDSATPEWHTIRLDAQQAAEHTPANDISFAIPIYVAPVSQRVMAALVDTCCIATGFLMAVAAVAYTSPDLPTGLPALLSCGVLLAALWLFYQLLFFGCSNATPGMRYARIGLCTFNDENPTRTSTLRRIGARLLAGMPFGLGLLWALLDEEGLGWHDRITRMYLRAY